MKALYDERDQLGLDAEQKYLVERYYRDFVRAGAQLSDADKTTLRALNQEESKLHDRVPRTSCSPDTKAGALVVDNESRARRPDATPRSPPPPRRRRSASLTGKWVLALQNTTQQPAQTSLKNRAVRERLFEASIDARRARRRERHAGDRRAPRAAPRARSAKLLGFPTYAAYALDDSDGEDAGERDQAADRSRSGRDGEGARRSGATCRS